MSKAKVLEELKRRAESGIDSLAMDFAKRMAPAGLGLAATLQSDDSEASFIGAAAKTWSEGAEALAKKMADEGASRDEIWQATGQMGSPTFKDVDGRWKQEISDDKSSVIGRDFRTEIADAYMAGDEEAVKRLKKEKKHYQYPHEEANLMSSVLDDDQLFSAYPDMKSTVYTRSPSMNLGSAMYKPSIDEVRMSLTNREATRSPLKHELQHAIQEREGFAKGGSPKKFASEFAENRARLNFLEKDPETQRVLAEYDEKQDELIMSDLEDPSQALEELRYEYMSNPYFKEHEKVMRKLRGKTDDGFREYQRLAGEAEARNVQTRLDYDMDKRVQNPPWNTLDVPEDELIVRGNKIAGIGAGIGALGLMGASDDSFSQPQDIASLIAMPGAPLNTDSIQGARQLGVLGNIADAIQGAERNVDGPLNMMIPTGTSDYIRKLQYGDDIGIIDRIFANPLL